MALEGLLALLTGGMGGYAQGRFDRQIQSGNGQKGKTPVPKTLPWERNEQELWTLPLGYGRTLKPVQTPPPVMQPYPSTAQATSANLYQGQAQALRLARRGPGSRLG